MGEWLFKNLALFSASISYIFRTFQNLAVVVTLAFGRNIQHELFISVSILFNVDNYLILNM